MRWSRDEEPPREVKVSGDLALGVALGDLGLDARDFHKVADLVREIIRVFLGDFPETEPVEG
jgi:hypothetical protein